MSLYKPATLPATIAIHNDGEHCAHNCPLIDHGCCKAEPKLRRLALDNKLELYRRSEYCKQKGVSAT